MTRQMEDNSLEGWMTFAFGDESVDAVQHVFLNRRMQRVVGGGAPVKGTA